jgi:DNA repair photolyase
MPAQPRSVSTGKPAALSSSPDLHGRGAFSQVPGRFETIVSERFDDGWDLSEEGNRLRTQVSLETSRSILTHNDSPDISFSLSVNPYRGCEHGCIYCYARPGHAWNGLSPGLDFESRIFARPQAPDLLEKELSSPHYRTQVIALGSFTDVYQPVERTLRITRALLEICLRFRQPVGVVTKSALVLRDLDILKPMADLGLVKVGISVTTLDPFLARRLEPRAPTPMRRIETIRSLVTAGIPVTVMTAPVIPALTDPEIETILTQAAQAGAREAGYVLLRLPQETKILMQDWLDTHYPDKAKHVFALMRDTHNGRLYDSAFGIRKRGTGPYAWMIGRRFRTACQRLGLNQHKTLLRTDLFSPPRPRAEQLTLF